MRPQNGARYRQVLLCRGDRSLRLDSSVKLYWQNLLFMCGTHHNFILNGSVFKIVSTWKHIDALETSSHIKIAFIVMFFVTQFTFRIIQTLR